MKIFAWGIGTIFVALYAWRLLKRLAADPRELENSNFLPVLLLQVAWMTLPFWHQWADPAEPSDIQLLDRMSARIWRAAISRTVGNAAGIYFAGLIVYMAVLNSRPSLVVPVAVTLGGAMIGASNRTWARLRKISTQLYKNARELERDLQQIELAEDGEKRKERDAARRSWDAVEIDLRTNVDTGYAFLGIPFLPSEVIVTLRKKVEQAIEGDQVALKAAREDLAKILESCEGRLDSAA
ncbi:hypothetical protein [Streptomyces roseolus]|uniref:hypothetical protein n=1 Tax=Streptomyces roseolus TaxID=67358 RepID=UPI0037A4FF54